MRQLMIMIQVTLLLVMAAGIAPATELSLSAADSCHSAAAAAEQVEQVELNLVAVPFAVGSNTPDIENELPPELEPAVLRERAFTEANSFAGIQVALPTSPLSIVFAADELLNPTYGLKLHLVW